MAISSKKSLWELKKNDSRGAKSSTRQAALQGRLDVGHAVGDREGELLDGRRAGLADVVAADRDRVPARQLARAELDRVDDEPHRRLGRVEELLLGDVLLEDVVLDRPLEDGAGHARLLGGDDVHRPDRRGRGVDRHRGADTGPAAGPSSSSSMSAQAADGDATRAELALGLRVVGVVAVQRGHVVGDRETRLAGVEQLAEAGVRVLGAAEAREHAHRPGPRPVARGVDAAGERRLAGQADVADGVRVGVAAGAVAQRVAVVVDLGGTARAWSWSARLSGPSGPPRGPTARRAPRRGGRRA